SGNGRESVLGELAERKGQRAELAVHVDRVVVRAVGERVDHLSDIERVAATQLPDAAGEVGLRRDTFWAQPLAKQCPDAVEAERAELDRFGACLAEECRD